MSADPGYFTPMVVEFSADTILSAILIFLWLMQRKEKHALCWGMAQISIMAAACYGLPAKFIAAVAYLFVRFIACDRHGRLLGGTQFFIGKLRAHQCAGWRRVFWSAAAYSISCGVGIPPG
jgi:hypothetical protein